MRFGRGPRRAPGAVVALLALAAAGVGAFHLAWHEPWRDESNALLEARSVPWGGLLGILRLEGIPPLYHALLKIAAAALPDPIALAAAGALGSAVLLWGTYRLLRSLSDAPRAAALITLALAPTYLYAYELGVVVRQYGLGLGFALAQFSYLRDALRGGRRRDVAAGTAAGALAALASAHSACVAGGVFLGFGLLVLARPRGVRLGWPILLALPCFALVLWLALPFPGRTPDANQVLRPPLAKLARLAGEMIEAGLVPGEWWTTESFFPETSRLAAALERLRGVAAPCAALGAALLLAARARACFRAWRVEALDVLAIALSWPPLLEIFTAHYPGGYRHQQYLTTPALLVLAGWAADRRRRGAFFAWARRIGPALLSPWLALQYGLAATNLALDHSFPFTDTKDAALALSDGARLLAEHDWQAAGILLFRPDVEIRAANGLGRHILYIAPDRAWDQRVRVAALLDRTCRADLAGPAPDPPARGALHYAGRREIATTQRRCLERVAYPRPAIANRRRTESIHLWRVDCACLLDPY